MSISGLTSRDMRLLKKKFIVTLNKLVDGLENNCYDKNDIFKEMKLGAYNPPAIPYIVQDLVADGLIEECNKDQVRITSLGRRSLENTIENNMNNILEFLYEKNRNIRNNEIMTSLGLNPSEINDAVSILTEKKLTEVDIIGVTKPFKFSSLSITSFGKYTHEKGLNKKESKNELKENNKINIIPTPVGSPYGFTVQDWADVSFKNADITKIYVVFGYQFASDFYETEMLIKNIKEIFESAIIEYKKTPNPLSIELDFKSLAAGYGEHVFNKITRDIISADIAIFDTSDLNSNVMIELGVALTWGIKVLPIRDEKSKNLPSDISGHTWVKYRNSGKEFLDKDYLEKIMLMISHCIATKQSI